MAAGGPQALGAYVVQLLRTVIFPLTWMDAMRIAREHKDTDPNGGRKVLAGIVLGILLAGAGTMALWSFQEASVDGMYASMNERMVPATGEDTYQASLDSFEAAINGMIVAAKKLNETIAAEGTPDQAAGAASTHASHDALTTAVADKQSGSVAAARKSGDVGGTLAGLRAQLSDLQRMADSLNGTTAQLNESAAMLFGWQHENLTADAQDALVDVEAAGPNHVLYLQVVPLVDAQKDAAVTGAFASAGVGDLEAASAAVAIKDLAVKDMNGIMVWFFWPSVIGFLYAPLVWATGSILRTGFEPSETVGFKPYPHRAMALFLLTGGAGWPSLFFSAWTFQDMKGRTEEGQIAL